MIFLRRPGVIHLDCFTDRADVFTFSKVNHSKNFIPEWWKKLPKVDPITDHPYGTMKSCQGFIDLFRKGLIIPLWSDISILLGEIGSDEIFWQYADQTSSAGPHPTSQRGYEYLPGQNYQHLKLDSPWIFKTKVDLDWVVHGVTWCNYHPTTVIIPEGILNFKWQVGTNINMFLQRKPEKQKILIEANQPLLQLIPMSEKEIVIHHHLISSDEMSLIGKKHKLSKFRNTYNVSKNIRLENESKCPFGFK